MDQPEPTVLRSHANPTVKRLVKMRDNRTRRRSGCFLVDGWRETDRALQSGFDLVSVYCAADQPETDSLAKSVIDRAFGLNAVTLVSGDVLEKISYGQSSRGVVAEFHTPDKSLAHLRLSPNPLVIVLDQIEKPGNLGAVFRCADGAGIDAVMVCDCAVDLFNPNTIRSSLGTVFSVNTAVATHDEIESWLLKHNIRPLAARVESSTEMWSADLSGGIALVLGNEANGLGDRWHEFDGQAIESIRIPMRGIADSLNISVSAAVLAYEAVRKRQ